MYSRRQYKHWRNNYDIVHSVHGLFVWFDLCTLLKHHDYTYVYRLLTSYFAIVPKPEIFLSEKEIHKATRRWPCGLIVEQKHPKEFNEG